MIYYKTKEEIELIRKSCLLVSATLAEVAKFLKPGITTLQVDSMAEEFIRDHGATLPSKITAAFHLPAAFPSMMRWCMDFPTKPY